MPIYRGSALVTPRRAGVDLARVYRGDRLVWQAGPTHIASGQFSGVVSNTEVRYFDQYTFLEGGVFTIEAESPPGPLRRLALEGPWGETLGATDLGDGTATVSTTAALSAGQVVRFGAVGSIGSTVSGTWTITKM